MEPVTHILTGACLARSGLNRSAAYATLTMAVAAEFPDIDTLWGLRGPIEGFEHHRGITHTFLGLPFEAAFLVAVIYGVHRWRIARAASAQAGAAWDPVRRVRPLTAAPVRWGRLYGLAVLALLSHLLLDYTNNYGLRPFYPFNSHWYAASIVFIFDPLMFAMLLVGLVAPALFGLVNSEVGARRQPFQGRGWAIAALLGVLSLWTLREIEHTRAVQLAMAQSIANPAQSIANPGQIFAKPAPTGIQPRSDAGLAPAESPISYLAAQRALASPDPLNPFRWPAVIDFGSVYQLAEIDTRDQTVRPGDTLQPKPARTASVLAAEASPLGRVYLDWSPMPFIDASPAALATGDDLHANLRVPEWTVVTFRDPRFMGETSLLNSSGRSPLTAVVTLNAIDKVVRQTMDGRPER